MGDNSEEMRSTSARLEWIALAVLLAVLTLAQRSVPFRAALERATLWIESLGWWAPAAFVTLYVLCALLLIPRTVLTVASGFLFGFGWGILWALLAINLAANLAFAIGRCFFREAVARSTRIRGNGRDRLRFLDLAVRRDGWRIVALTRLSPVFPYSLLNYAFGLTRVTWGQYLLGSFAGMLPGTLLLVSLGTLTDFAAERSAQNPGRFSHLALAGTVFAAFGATLLIARFAKRELARYQREEFGEHPKRPSSDQ